MTLHLSTIQTSYLNSHVRVNLKLVKVTEKSYGIAPETFKM